MKKSDFYYNLPEELIAQVPIEPRDASRLMVYDGKEDKIYHKHFYDITEYLNKGDLLVLNDTKVIKARLYGETDSGAKVEVLLLKRAGLNIWETIAKPAKRLKKGKRIKFSDFLNAEVIEDKKEGGVRVLKFESEGTFEEALDKTAVMPLPPYIKSELKDLSRYQTVYCRDENSAAAPTAGLHFTKELLNAIVEKGVEIAKVTLNVGLGTFRPVKEENIEDHKMHSEFFEITEENAKKINLAKKEGRRVVCVGTTSVRAVESAAKNGRIEPTRTDTDIFIYPGYRFKIADALITNFHLPESTLIMLVSAFIGREKTLFLYETAVKERYRFFSFGDAMFLTEKIENNSESKK